MNSLVIDLVSEQLARQYRDTLVAMTGHLAKTLDAGDPTGPKARIELHTSVLRVSDSALYSIMSQVLTATEALKYEALNELKVEIGETDAAFLDQHISELNDDLQISLEACLKRDCQIIERELRRFSLRVDLLRVSTGISQVGAIIKARFGVVSGVVFAHANRLGRKMTSDLFVRNLIRHHLLTASVESRLLVLSKTGSDLANLVSKDGDVIEIFSITGANSLVRSYEDIRDEVFHPNSNASVTEFKG